MENNAKASTPWRRLMSVTGERRGRPTIGPQRNDLLRDLARAIVREDFDDNVSRATKALGLSGGTLGDFLRGDKGAGMRVIEGPAAHTGRTIDQLMASGGDLAALRAMEPPTPIRGRTFGELPEWPELLAKARVLRPSVPDAYWTKLATTDVWVDGGITVAIVCDMAEFLLRHR